MQLNAGHVEILSHTLRRAANEMFCGDSPQMQELVNAGLMVSCGKVAWCPDECFTITPAGRAAMKQKEGPVHAG